MSVTAIDALLKRRTVRNYLPDPIPKEQLEKIMEAAKASPTAGNFQGHDYIFVKNKEKLDELEKALLEDLPLEMKQHVEERRIKHGVKNSLTCDAPCLVLIVKNERSSEDWCQIDAGIASMSIMIAAQNFNLGSMCIGAIAHKTSSEKCEKVFGLKKGSLLLGVAIGKPSPNVTFPPKEIVTKISVIE